MDLLLDRNSAAAHHLNRAVRGSHNDSKLPLDATMFDKNYVDIKVRSSSNVKVRFRLGVMYLLHFVLASGIWRKLHGDGTVSTRVNA